MERGDRELDQVSRIFFNLVGTDSNPKRNSIQTKISPMLAAFWDDMKTSSSGDVFYQMFPEGCNTFSLQDECDYVVIEWSDMRTQDGNSEEDFQVILYAGNDTPTGDGEIKVQYKEFNNIQ